jgi:hypothetical protein
LNLKIIQQRISCTNTSDGHLMDRPQRKFHARSCQASRKQTPPRGWRLQEIGNTAGLGDALKSSDWNNVFIALSTKVNDSLYKAFGVQASMSALMDEFLKDLLADKRTQPFFENTNLARAHALGYYSCQISRKYYENDSNKPSRNMRKVPI